MCASFHTNLGMPSYGCCIRNEVGEFVWGAFGLVSSGTSEAVSLLSAIRWAYNTGLQYFVLVDNVLTSSERFG